MPRPAAPRSPSRTLLAASLAFIAGVAAHAFLERGLLPVALPAIALAAALSVALVSRLPLLALATVACAVGFVRYDGALLAAPPLVAPPSSERRYEGVVAAIPDQTVRGAVVRMRDVRSGDERIGEADLRFRVPLDVAQGDALEWACAMRVRPTDGSAWCAPRQLPSIAERLPGWHPARALSWFKARVRTTISRLLPEPDASVVLGLLLGDTGGMPQSVVASFRATGTSHLLAVSGSNVQQVLEAAFVLLAAVGLRRRRAVAAVAVLLLGFTVITGAQSSVVRAAIIGGFGLLAAAVGRRASGMGPLVLAAAGMLWIDPTLLRHDVGFQLSFSAVLGLRAFGKTFAALLGREDELGLKAALGETLAASVTTIPVSMFTFGTLPIGSPIANLAVVPFVPSIMAAGAIALALGSAWAPLAAPFAFVAGAFCHSMIGVITWFGKVSPLIQYQPSFWEMLAMYAALAACAYFAQRPRTT